MKRNLLCFVLILFTATAFSQSNPGLGDVSAPGVFYDTFDEPIDLTKWSLGNQKWATDNGGIVPENVSQSDGNLVIEAHGNNYTGPVEGFGQNTKVGGGLISKAKLGPGIYEVRAKVCPQLGALSAFWTYEYGADGQTGYSEIDFEVPAFKTPGNPSFEYLFCNNWETETKYETVAAEVSPLNDGQYHIFRFEWYPASISATPHVDYYLDGELLTSSTHFVPNFDAQFWIAIWFPTWAGTPDFDTDHMYVDWFKYTPATTDPGLPGDGSGGDTYIEYADFDGDSNIAFPSGDVEEGGSSNSTSSFVDASGTGKIMEWNYNITPNTLGYSYAYVVVNKDALATETPLDIFNTRFLKFWAKSEGDAIGKVMFINLANGRNRSKYQTPVLNEGWNEIEIPILKDSITNIAFVFESDGATTTSGTVYIDNIELRDVSSPDGGTVPPNGGLASDCADPASPGVISGNTSTTQGSIETYSVEQDSAATSYTWTLPAGWSGTSSTNSINATVGSEGGVISVTANNLCGSGPASTLTVTATPAPSEDYINYADFDGESNTAIPGGDAEEGGSSISENAFVDASGTGNILEWNFGLNPNTLGYSYAYLVVNKNALPTETMVNTNSVRFLKFWVKAEGDAVGKSMVVNLANGRVRTRYQTPLLAEGWNEIELTILKDAVTNIAFVFEGDGATTASGTVYIDDIELSAESSLEGGSNPPNGGLASECMAPSQPGAITGRTSVKQGRNLTYSVAIDSATTSYTWTLPDGWSGTSTTNSIDVIAGSESGIISVIAHNTCGSSDSSTLVVTVRSGPNNLALNKTVVASSHKSNDNSPSKAVDGNKGTRWASQKSKQEWIYVDLGAAYNIWRVKIIWDAGLYGRDYKVQMSSDASSWSTIHSVNKNKSLVNNLKGLSGTGRYVRIKSEKSHNAHGYSILEFKVFGAASSARIGDSEAEAGSAVVSVTAFPNPTTSRITIRLGSFWEKGGMITLHNSSGKQIKTEKIAGKEHSFELSNLPDGLYFINLSNSGKRATYKFYKE
ncbi:MAG TPA: discoidin domain-containing protein [Cytophagales bacterium]|nr:discoidin domain-containing protein [Cytophagales bacterium]